LTKTGSKSKFTHLIGSGFDELLTTVSDGHIPQGREAVDKALSSLVEYVGAFSSRNDDGAETKVRKKLVHNGKWVPKMVGNPTIFLD